MSRYVALLSVAAALAVTGCHRAIRVPSPVGVQPETAPFVRGVNARTQLFDYELPGVSVEHNVAAGIAIKGLPVGIQKVDQRHVRSYSLTRQGQPLTDARCEATQKGMFTSFGAVGQDDSKHELRCEGRGFQLSLQEGRHMVYRGTVTRGTTTLELASTDQMAKGLSSNLNGFHLTRNGEWIASFEYFWGGAAYLRPGLTPEEREAAVLAMLSVVSTDGWLGRNPDENQPKSLVGFAR